MEIHDDQSNNTVAVLKIRNITENDIASVFKCQKLDAMENFRLNVVGEH